MTKIQKLFFLLSVLLYLGACGGASNPDSEDSEEENTSESSSSTTTPEASPKEPEPELSELALAGKKLFQANCSQCHLVDESVLIGPGLKGVTKRQDKEWTLKFIKNSQAVIESGDEYAVALYEQYNKTLMQSFPWPDEDLEAVYAYLEAL